MPEYLIDSLNQKYEVGTFQLFFSAKDGEVAESIFNTLDRAKPLAKKFLELSRDPAIQVYLYPDAPSFERATHKALGVGETIRANFSEHLLLMCASHLPMALAEEVSQQLCYVIFHDEVKERELPNNLFRTPSWIRDGYCLQVSARIKTDGNALLLKGWTKLQEAEKNGKLVRPNLMTKSIAFIPDETRRELAFFQSFFMIKFLQTVYPEKFFKRFATLMSAIEDMEAEKAFEQITGYDFEKFFSLFREWVHATNLWAAVTD